MTNFFQTMGGLGLFLLGMIIMTGALRVVAGEVIRAALMRFTRSPLTGAMTGAASTVLLQSSSATTVAAVGFVGAGLMSFPESLGIIFGANIGTTIKGWLVALLGFKYQLGTLILPVIFFGVMLKLFARSHMANIGFAVAGFGLIFVGIDYMQQGMGGLQSLITPDIFPQDSFIGRLKLVFIGILITVLIQSSSAGVALALTAVFSGVINFEQAAALVIGMDVGTTVTAFLATIGASVNARRTGFSHVIYNVMTGVGAFLFLTPYTLIWELLAPGQLILNAEVALVAFHSSFNLLGVIIVLPFTNKFAHFIQTRIPDKSDAYTQSLDKKCLNEPDIALIAAQESIRSELLALLKHLNGVLDIQYENQKVNLSDLQLSLNETHAYVDLIHLEKNKSPDWKVLLSVIHSLDHMQRLHKRCEEDVDRAVAAKQTPEISRYIDVVSHKVSLIIDDIGHNKWGETRLHATEIARVISKDAGFIRKQIMTKIGTGEINVLQGTDYLEGIRWLRRVSAHILRIIHHQAIIQELLGKKHSDKDDNK